MRLASGELAGLAAGEFAEVQPVEPALGGRCRNAPAGAEGARGEGDVVANGKMRKEPVVLEDQADGALLGRHEDVGAGVVEGLPVERDSSFGQPDEARQHA